MSGKKRADRGAQDLALDESSPIEDAAWRNSLRRRLLKWFGQNARQLPWRTQPSPYYVWVSEVMLQQTQVATVLPYFHRFIAAFPTIADLASADEQTLMSHWEGLGYYRRARLMHQAAKRIVSDFGGEFPERFSDVLELPGIGRYTAGAILSISRDQRLPILEGNTVRVFSRWVAMRGDVKSAEGTARLWQIAERMLPAKGSGAFNQASMELGALICRPQDPLCGHCPVAANCRAYERGLQQSIPGKVTRIEYVDRREFAFVIPSRTRPAWLVYQIPPGARWAGLWDFPRDTTGMAKDVSDSAETMSRGWDIPVAVKDHLKTIRHGVTKYRITLEVHKSEPVNESCLGEFTAANPTVAGAKFASLQELEAMPLSVTGRKIAKLLAIQRTGSLF